MDCGPASLKCLLEGFGIHAGYERLREACQTTLDGTSIDTMEAVANQLGLEAEQIMLPLDHLLLRSSHVFPAIVITTLPSGLTHFVVLWRRHGGMLQVMDPAAGRRWVTHAQFLKEVYCHKMTVPAAAWQEFAESEEFARGLRARLRAIGVSAHEAERPFQSRRDEKYWHGWAALDGAARFTAALVHAGALRGARECSRFLNRAFRNSEIIPARYWSVRPTSAGEDGAEEVVMTGAVLVRIRGKATTAPKQALASDLAAAVSEPQIKPARELLTLLRRSGSSGPALLLIATAAAAAAGGVVFEAVLFRSLFDIRSELALAGQRMGAVAAILLFGFALLLLELPLFSIAVRLGRQIENRLRMAFLAKIPNLRDRYFQSRLISDMAERGHASQRLRHLPDLLRQLLRAILELLATAAAIIWLEPSAAAPVMLTALAALLPAFLSQSLLIERDLRVRGHSAGLTRFYLDAMLGLVAIRAHAAESSVRREHKKLLGEWTHAGLRLQRAVVGVEAIQLCATFGLVAFLLLAHPLAGKEIGRILLIVYWALNLPALGQDIGALTRQYPSYRNVTLRLLEPLGAPEEEPSVIANDQPASAAAPSIEYRDVCAQAAGHTILERIDLSIEPGSHIAVVGPSGAGKSSLVGMLLGWLKPNAGEILIDGSPLNHEQLRSATAWVDPAVQLWNRSLFANLAYGSKVDVGAVAKILDSVLLRHVLESLPEGLQTKLGEGGALVSGGEGQRVRLGRAMLRQNVKLVILDEPFRGLDREKRRELLARAREFWRGCTLICVTHDITETRSFDRVVVIEHGHIAEEGRPAELAGDSQSRYAQLLRAEAWTQSSLWSSRLWRRIRVYSGKIIEEMPEANSQDACERPARSESDERDELVLS